MDDHPKMDPDAAILAAVFPEEVGAPPASPGTPDFKLEAARTYVGRSDVQQVREEILGAVDGVKLSLDRMNERLDRVVENAAKRTPVHRA